MNIINGLDYVEVLAWDVIVFEGNIDFLLNLGPPLPSCCIQGFWGIVMGFLYLSVQAAYIFATYGGFYFEYFCDFWETFLTFYAVGVHLLHNFVSPGVQIPCG